MFSPHPIPPHQLTRIARIAGMTLPQEQRAWARIRSPGTELWRSPEGFTVKHLPTSAAAKAVGRFMHNCWQSDATPANVGYGIYHSLHDEYDLPRAAFFAHPGPRIDQIEGRSGFLLREPYASVLHQYAKDVGASIEGKDPDQWKADHLNDLDWENPDEDPDDPHWDFGQHGSHKQASPFKYTPPPRLTPEQAAEGRSCYFHPDRPAVKAEGFAAMCQSCADKYDAVRPEVPAWQLNAKTADYYHVAPTFDRQRILQHGLQPSNPALNTRWFDYLDEEGDPIDDESQWKAPDWLRKQPEGVYTMDDPERALEVWGYDPNRNDDNTHYDVWQIPEEQVRRKIPDPITRGTVVQHGVQPTLYSGPEHRDNTWELNNPVNPLSWPGLDQRRQLGIGLPDRVIGKTANKLHDFLMNPKSRPDLQTPEAQDFLKLLAEQYHNKKTDHLMPWLTREWKKGRIESPPNWRTMTYRGPDDLAPNHIGGGRLDHWADFYHSNHPIRRELGDIMKHPVHSFANHVQRWDQAMEDEAVQQALSDGEVVHTTPDGWTIRNLTTPEELKAEGKSMGHCVGGYHHLVSSGDTMIHSLRDPQGVPHATIEINPTQYESPYDGVTTEQYGGDQGAELNTPIPHRGEVVQIQGKANQIPLPEYKEKIKNWFDTFPPDQKPTWQDSGDYLMDPSAIEDRHLNPDSDEYGLPSPRPDMDYPALLNGLMEGRGGYRNPQYDPHMGERVYQLARAHGEIPEFGNEVQNFGERQQENFDEWRHMNYEHAVPFPQGDEEYPYTHNGETYDTPEEHEEAYNQDEAEWAEEHAGMQAANHLHSLINPHWQNNEAQPGLSGYVNEPQSQQTFAYTNK